MAPVATEPDRSGSNGANVQDLKAKLAKSNGDKAYNPFYSPPDADDGDDDYEYSQYKALIQLFVSRRILSDKYSLPCSISLRSLR